MTAATRVALRCLQTGALIFLLFLFLGVKRPPPPRPRIVGTPSAPGRGIPNRVADSAATLLLESAPFRAARHPAEVAFDPVHAGETPQPKPTRPLLTLRGILWGLRPVALIEGLPAGSILLGVGDTLGGIRVKRIEHARVVLVGFDTTWVLPLDSIGR
jgi:hypothetical protein